MGTPEQPLLRKPLVGGLFGRGRFELASQPIISSGLHAVRFMVLESRAGRVLAIAETKVEALAGARRVLRADRAVDAGEPQWTQPRLWPDAELVPVPVASSSRPVARRRREIFERSAGRCHYCGCELVLAGVWHVEHQMPQALGGTDDAGNLVAACAPCNLSKSDRTAIEFIVAN